MILVKRKCHICKRDIILDQDNSIYHNKKYAHFDCHVAYKLSNRRNKLTEDDLIHQALEIQKLGIAVVQDIVAKEKLYKWLQYNYNIVVLPKYFFTKLDSIYDGTYKGLARGIPAEDLFDMWQRKKTELDRIAESKKRKGEPLEGFGRVQYDLAILVNKYDSYLSWKEKQRMLQQEQTKRLEESKIPRIDFGNINKAVEKQSNNEETDIGNLLDELF